MSSGNARWKSNIDLIKAAENGHLDIFNMLWHFDEVRKYYEY